MRKTISSKFPRVHIRRSSFCENNTAFVLQRFETIVVKVKRNCLIFEPRHDKTNTVSVRPAKTQISLGIRPVWSESSLSAWRNLGPLATHWAQSEDSDRTGRMPRLLWVFAGRTVILLVLSCRGSFQYRAVGRTGRSGDIVPSVVGLEWRWESDSVTTQHRNSEGNYAKVCTQYIIFNHCPLAI